MLDGPPYAHAVVNKALPSVLSPTIAVNSPSGKVYETPSTVSASEPPLRSNSPSGPVDAPLPASIAISSESSPVKLVLRSIWNP